MHPTSAFGWHRHCGFHGLIGMARGDITPPIGIYNRNWGAARIDTASGIHAPLTATALALNSLGEQGRPTVLLGLDLGWWGSPRWEADFHSQLRKGLNLPKECLLIAMTHTHSGPALQLDRTAESIAGGELLHAYYRSLVASCIAICSRALADLQPGWLEFSSGQCSLAANRDLFEPDGRAVCGFNPQEAADSLVVVGRCSRMDGSLLGTLVNYACHPTSLGWQNSLISPDFPGAMRDLIESVNTRPCLFLQGASGDLGPRDQYSHDLRVAECNGRQLGYAALSIMEGMLPAGKALRYAGVQESGTALGLWETVSTAHDQTLKLRAMQIRLPLKTELIDLEALLAEMAACEEGPLRERLRRRIVLRQNLGPEAEYLLAATCLRIGDALLFTLASEPDSSLQQAVRSSFPGRAVLIGGLVNGALAYQPRRERYGSGNYQTEQTPYAPGNLELTIEQLIETGRCMLSDTNE